METLSPQATPSEPTVGEVRKATTSLDSRPRKMLDPRGQTVDTSTVVTTTEATTTTTSPIPSEVATVTPPAQSQPQVTQLLSSLQPCYHRLLQLLQQM